VKGWKGEVKGGASRRGEIPEKKGEGETITRALCWGSKV